MHRAPRVAIITTGDELVAPGRRATGRGRIPDSNAVLLAAVVASAGAEIVSVSRVGDDPPRFLAEVERVVAEASADVVISTGGVSVGAHDPVKAALAPGGRIAFRTVDMQPGRPQAFGALPSGALFFGLPGNPVSVAVSFEVFVRPAIRALQGLPPVASPAREAVVAEGWRPRDERRQYMPVRFDEEGRIRPATGGGSASHLAGALASAEGFAIVPSGTAEVAAGDILPVLEVSS
ncbi:molybdopterin molybdotransferase MoeA [Agromyces protaetiae]|uniref:molybdopterin molybdotransferase MoeA n=1 Tax=Agromyces protaetiae TaxID=2509455 RepID=UPI001FB754E8|nr:molybdopterin-binding protein [Agromyces protaetiae]